MCSKTQSLVWPLTMAHCDIAIVPSVPGGARDTGIRRHNMECSECSTNWPFLGEEIKLTIDDTGQMKPDCYSIAKQQTNKHL